MTNYEHYKEEIKRIVNLGLHFAVDKNTQRIAPCADFECKDCLFTDSSSCNIKKFKWGYEEYDESDVDWSKVPVDTKIWVRDSEYGQLLPRHFAKYENNKVYAWCTGATSFSAKGNVTEWKYAKLAEEE